MLNGLLCETQGFQLNVDSGFVFSERTQLQSTVSGYSMDTDPFGHIQLVHTRNESEAQAGAVLDELSYDKDYPIGENGMQAYFGHLLRPKLFYSKNLKHC